MGVRMEVKQFFWNNTVIFLIISRLHFFRKSSAGPLDTSCDSLCTLPTYKPQGPVTLSEVIHLLWCWCGAWAGFETGGLWLKTINTWQTLRLTGLADQIAFLQSRVLNYNSDPAAGPTRHALWGAEIELKKIGILWNLSWDYYSIVLTYNGFISSFTFSRVGV